MARFQGKVVLVTGGTSGIGRAAAEAFAAEGAKIVLSGRREPEGLAVAEGIRKAGGEATEADYRKVFDANVWGVLAAMKYEIPEILKAGGGSVINTSSIAGHVGMAGVSVYIASKHAVEGLTKAAALEYAKQGVRVNAVAPAAIVTEMMDRFVGGEHTDQAKGLAAMHPVGRMGRADEVAASVLYLASDAARFVTGVSLPVDGGWLAQ